MKFFVLLGSIVHLKDKVDSYIFQCVRNLDWLQYLKLSVINTDTEASYDVYSEVE